MKTKVIFTLLKKELLNIIRDKKSFLFMILLPLLMFPIMLGGMTIMMSLLVKVDETVKIGVNYEVTEDFNNFTENYEKESGYDIEIIYDTNKNLKSMFDDGDIGVYVIKDNGTYTLHYDESSTTFLASSMLAEELYTDYSEKYLEDKLLEKGIDLEKEKESFKVEVNQESITDMGSLVPSIISMVLIMMISSVAYNVAIEVTTSEKEKGTLETLLSLPITKAEMITSKFLTVFLLSITSGFLTYISLFTTLHFASSALVYFGVNSIAIDFKVLLIYFVGIILVSLLFSGLLLSITIFSKNLKEAQNSLYPLEIFVSVVSMLPMFGINYANKYALIPFVNMTLLFNNALSMNVESSFVILTLASTLIYSMLLILIVSKIYNSEDVLYNTKSINYLKFTKNGVKTNNFSVPAAVFISIISMFIALYFSILFINKSKYFLASLTGLSILLVVIISSFIVNLDYKECFKIKKFSIKSLLILFGLYAGTYIIATCIVNYIIMLFPHLNDSFSLIEEYITGFDNIFLNLLVIAIVPGIAEELLFRGVLYNSFNKKWGTVVAILLSSIFFGVYHMNWTQGIFAFIMGIVLAYSYYKSGSIFVPIIIHIFNNSLSVISEYIPFLNFEITLVILGISLILVITMFYLSKKYLKAKDLT